MIYIPKYIDIHRLNFQYTFVAFLSIIDSVQNSRFFCMFATEMYDL